MKKNFPYVYNPTELINTLNGHTQNNREHDYNNRLLYENNAKQNQIAEMKLKISTHVNDISAHRFLNATSEAMSLLSHGKLLNEKTFPNFSLYPRKYAFTAQHRTNDMMFKLNNLKHNYQYQIARASRSFPIDFTNSQHLNINLKRELVVEALAYIAMVINSTIEIPYYSNCLSFYQNNIKDNDKHERIQLILNARLNNAKSTNPKKHLTYKPLFDNSLAYNSNSSAIPISTKLNPYSLRQVILYNYSFDIKNNTYVEPDTRKEYLELLDILKQSYLRLPPELLAAVCEPEEILAYYDGLAPECHFGIDYHKEIPNLKIITLNLREKNMATSENVAMKN